MLRRVLLALPTASGLLVASDSRSQQETGGGALPRLATSVVSPQLPTTVFVHGLDSSKQTWTSVQAELLGRGYPSLAVDLRGHGESELGDPTEFTAEALAKDVLSVAKDLPKPFVLVGHSMGGRIAMRAAAIADKGTLGAVVIEDIDTRVSSGGSGDPDEAFERSFDSQKDAVEALVAAGYDLTRVESWLGTRVRRLPSGRWHSDVSPQAQRLGWYRVLNVDDADRAWDTISSHKGGDDFEVHLWVAGREGTVCEWDGPRGITDLVDRLGADRCNLKTFHRAAHSIHNTDRTAFLDALVDVIDRVARTKPRDL